MAILILNNGLEDVVGQASGLFGIMSEPFKASGLWIEAIHAVGPGPWPDEAIVVFKNTDNVIARQRAWVIDVILIVGKCAIGRIET